MRSIVVVAECDSMSATFVRIHNEGDSRDGRHGRVCPSTFSAKAASTAPTILIVDLALIDEIWLLFAQTPEEELIAGDTAQYLLIGHIVYAVENNLFAIPFDLDRLEVVGGPMRMVEGIFLWGVAPQYVVSDLETLVFVTEPTGAVTVQ